MAKLYDDTLPCLQAVGPWWNQQDRLQLFCYLKDVFDLDSEYLASLSASKLSNDDGDIKLTEQDITSEYDKYTIARKNSGKNLFSCSKIRGVKFSFGKLNKRLCFLCPYSRLFKNYNLYDEIRFIYYLMQSKELSLSKYTGNDKDALPEIFSSYFPAFVGDVLFDAFPFSYFAESFLDLNEGEYLSNPEKIKNEILCQIRKSIASKINYIHNKEIYFEQYPDYANMLMNSADKTFLFLEHNDFRRSFNRPMIARLYSLIKDNRKYVPLKPHEYLNENSNYFDTDRFMNSVPDFYGEASTTTVSLGTCDKTLINDDSLITMDEIPEKEKEPDIILSSEDTKPVPSVNILFDLEDDSLKGLKELDAAIVENNLSLNGNLTCEPNTSASVSPEPTDEVEEKSEIPFDFVDSNLSEPLSSENTEANTYQEFYNITNKDDIFIYGTSGDDNDQLLLNIFFDDASFLNMEPAIIDNTQGILIVNPLGNKLFYSIELYGPRPIRKLADKKIPVYTSNRYYLCKYLYKSKVFKLDIKDVGISLSIQRNQALKNIASFSNKNFPDCMLSYAELYEQAISIMSIDEKLLLYRMENLSSIICSDGMPLPFSHMENLCRVHDSLNIEFLYKVDMIPNIPGVFVFLRASKDSFKQNTTVLNGLYVETCIELNKFVPFTSGKSFLLKLNEKGMLIFFTGSELELSQYQLQLSSCVRRCFSNYCPKTTPVIIEEKTHVHTLKK